MNAELRSLLERAGVRASARYSDFVVINSDGLLPRPGVLPGEPIINRGFDLIVLEDGRQRYFGKVRAAVAPHMPHASKVRRALATLETPYLRVPTATFVPGETVSVQLAPFMSGDSLFGHLKDARPAWLTEELRRILPDLHALESHAIEMLDLGVDWATPLDLFSAVEAHFETAVGAAGLAAPQLKVLRDVLRAAGSVRPRPQHGDLWGENILLADGRAWLIDFEAYGQVIVPLYDVLHLGHTSLTASEGEHASGLALLRASHPLAVVVRGAIAASMERNGITRTQLDGLLAFYLIRMSTELIRRSGGRQVYAEPLLRSLRELATALAHGERDLLAL